MFSRLGVGLLRQSRSGAAALAGRRAPAVRRMGSGGHHGGDFHISPVHLQLSKVMATACWVWMFWRAYNDGAVVLGLMHPWDAHGHGHHDSHAQYKESSFDTTPELDESGEGHDDHDEHEEEDEE